MKNKELYEKQLSTNIISRKYEMLVNKKSNNTAN